MCFTIFQKEKTPFKAIKTKRSKSRKIDIFPKGLTHGLTPKWPFVQHFFQAIFARKMSLTIFYNEKTPFQAIKTRRSKNRKINPWFQTKNGHFSKISFQAIQARKMSFTIIYDKKANFQLIKTRSLKSRKINIFKNGITHGFRRKMAIFKTFFLGIIRQENVFYDILQREKLLSRL